jgi:hypothetical protein
MDESSFVVTKDLDLDAYIRFGEKFYYKNPLTKTEGVSLNEDFIIKESDLRDYFLKKYQKVDKENSLKKKLS